MWGAFRTDMLRNPLSAEIKWNTTVTIEVRMLAWSLGLGLVYIFTAAVLGTAQRGLEWNVSNRDGEAKPLTGIAARAARANSNFLETFSLFVTAVLAAAVTHRATAHTALGAQCYFWARTIYLPVYLIGIPYLRTLIFAVSVWGLLQFLEVVW